MNTKEIPVLEWISVQDAMPPLDKGVVTTDGTKTSYGSFTGYRKDNDNKLHPEWKSTNEVWKVTHWLNLPKLIK